jgi:PEP-CTERM motif
LSELVGDNFFLGDVGPGETLEFTYDYFAEASTGFGETGVIAAIGDRFNLSTAGGRFVLEGLPSGPGPGTGVPEPATLAMLGLGYLVLFGISARHRRYGVQEAWAEARAAGAAPRQAWAHRGQRQARGAVRSVRRS